MSEKITRLLTKYDELAAAREKHWEEVHEEGAEANFGDLDAEAVDLLDDLVLAVQEAAPKPYEGPASVLAYPLAGRLGLAKNYLFADFIGKYREMFDGRADTEELFTDILTDLLHVLSVQLKVDGEFTRHPQLGGGADAHYLDTFDRLYASAIGHYRAETTFRG